MNQIERINRDLWGDFFKGFSSPDYIVRPFFEGLADDSFKVDVKDCKDNYVISAELPGVNKQDIKVEVEDNKVTISAQTQKISEEKSDEKVVRSERYYGWMSRSIRLEQAVKTDGSSAKYDNGVLTLTLPKVENHRGRFLEVH